jgi:Flp pilus assembly protein TadG
MVHLNRKIRDDRGSVVVIFAICALSIFVLAALVVDLGLARATKGESQSSSDSAALAAADALWPGTGTLCKSDGSKPPCFADAVAAAKTYAQNNFNVKAADWSTCPAAPTGFTVYDATVTCVSFNFLTGQVSKVWFLMPTRTVKTTFGNVAGVSSVPIRTQAQAGFNDGQLRPWGLCSGALGTTGNVTFVPFKDGVANPARGGPSDPCGLGAPPGNWWVAQCAGQSGGSGGTQTSLDNGCSETHSPVANQPNPATPLALRTFLQTQCPSATGTTTTCLGGDNGNNFQNVTQSDFQGLVGTTFTMPVFCSKALCDQFESTGSGSNADYAIQQVATVILCGFTMKNPSTGWPTTGPCATNNPYHYVSSDVTAGTGVFIVVTGLFGGNTDPFRLASIPVALTQ